MLKCLLIRISIRDDLIRSTAIIALYHFYIHYEPIQASGLGSVTLLLEIQIDLIRYVVNEQTESSSESLSTVFTNNIFNANRGLLNKTCN